MAAVGVADVPAVRLAIADSIRCARERLFGQVK